MHNTLGVVEKFGLCVTMTMVEHSVCKLVNNSMTASPFFETIPCRLVREQGRRFTRQGHGLETGVSLRQSRKFWGEVWSW